MLPNPTNSNLWYKVLPRVVRAINFLSIFSGQADNHHQQSLSQLRKFLKWRSKSRARIQWLSNMNLTSRNWKNLLIGKWVNFTTSSKKLSQNSVVVKLKTGSSRPRGWETPLPLSKSKVMLSPRETATTSKRFSSSSMSRRMPDVSTKRTWTDWRPKSNKSCRKATS